MKLGVVVDGGRGFVEGLLADWRGRYETTELRHREVRWPVARGRVNAWRLQRALQHLLDQNDVVFFEWAGPLLAVASRLRGRAGIVARLHSYELYDVAPQVRWEAVDRVVLVSQAMRRRFLDDFAPWASKVRVVSYGKDLERYRPLEHPPGNVLGMLGGLVPIKRTYEVVLAVHELRQDGHPVRLRLGGDRGHGADNSRYYLSLLRLVDRLALGEAVELTGPVADVPGWLNGIDLFVSNSYWEGQQNALLEAMACGCMCVSHEWDGAEEVLPDAYRFTSAAELKCRVVALLGSDETARQAHRRRMRSIAEQRFDVRRERDVFAALFAEVSHG